MTVPWGWEELDADDRAANLIELWGWVRGLIARYELYDAWPVCWYRHDGFVAEVTALWALWLQAYHLEDAPPDDALAFHDRLRGVLATSAAELRRHGRHDPGEDAALLSRRMRSLDQLDRALHADLQQAAQA
jgi:hypothetical protein